MSDRANTITVVLERETRVDDCQEIIEAIEMIRGVLSAKVNVSDLVEHMAQERARNDLGEKLWKILYPSQV